MARRRKHKQKSTQALLAAMARRTERNINPRELEDEEARPSLYGVRQAINASMPDNMTPPTLAHILEGAANLTDTETYFKLAETLEERDLQFRALLSTRKLAVQSLDFIVEAATDDARDVEIADEVRTLLESDVVQEAIPDLLNGLRDGVAVCEAVWKTGRNLWTIDKLIYRPSWFFTFDKLDARTVKLRSDTPGGEPTELTPGKYVVHLPGLKTGAPIRGGLAFPAAWAWLIKSIALKDWVVFAEIFGQPLRLGTYAPGTRKEDIKILRRAVEALGTDAAAILPENMRIQFIDAVRAGGGGEVYERLCSYLDAQLAKLVLGQTLTSGDGAGVGSYALGKVHGDVRADIVRADAKALARTIRRYIVEPFVHINWGSDAELPGVRFDCEEPEDLDKFISAVERAVNLGVEIEQSVIRDRLGLEDPAPGAKLLQRPSAPALPFEMNTRRNGGCPVHGTAAHATQEPDRDAFDDLADDLYGDWERVSEPAREFLLQAVRNATTLDEMREALEKAILEAPADALIEALTIARTKARVAGESGADI